MTQRTSNVILSYSVDQAGLQKALDGNKRLAGSYASIEDAAAALNLNTEQIAQLQAQAGQASTTAANQVAQAQQKAATSYDQVAASAEKAAQAQADAATAGKGISSQQAASRIAGLGGIVGGQAGGELFRDASQFIQLTSTFGAAGAGAAGLALGLKALSDSEKHGEEVTKQVTDAQKAYFEAIESGSRDSIKNARDQAATALKVSQDLQSYYQQVLSQAGVDINQQLGLLAPIAKIGEALGLPGATGITKGYVDALAAANTAVAQNTALLGAYDRALDASGVAARAATQAEEDLVKARDELLAPIADKQMKDAQLAIRANEMTDADRQKRIGEINEEIRILEARRKAQDTTVAADIELGKQEEALKNERDFLGNVTNTYAQAEANLAKQRADQLKIITDSITYSQQLAEQIRSATVDQTTDRLAALQEEREALLTFIPELEKLAPVSEDAAKQLEAAQLRLGQIGNNYSDQLTRVLPAAILRSQQQLTADIAKLAADSAAKIEQIQADERDKEADAQAKAVSDRADAERKAEQDRQSALEDHLKRVADIESSFQKDYRSAVFKRDAVAAYEAEQKRKQDLDKEQSDYDERVKKVDDALAEQNRVIDQRLNEQLQQARAAADKSIQQERQRLNAEANEKIAAYNAQLAALSSFTTQGTNQIASFVNGALSFLGRLPSQIGSPTPISVIETPGSWTPLPPVTGTQPGHLPRNQVGIGYYATGIARVPSDGLAYLHAGERVLTAAQNRMFSANANRGDIVINLGGIHGTKLSRRQIIDMIDDRIDETLPPDW